MDAHTPPSVNSTELRLRAPGRADGAAIHALIQACPPLDCNSCYAYLVLVEHFGGTCVIAEDRRGRIVGFISAYSPPGQPDTLFVWQVAVDASARGQGLAQRMLADLLARPACAGIRYVDTTVSPGNQASRALFHRFAASCQAVLTEHPLFQRQHFGGPGHDDEPLLRIGPLAVPAPGTATARESGQQAVRAPALAG